MFYSHEILGTKSPLGMIWTLAHGSKKMSKNKILSADIRELCQSILQPNVPFALRLQGILINGVVCVYEKKQIYLLRDLMDMRKRVESAATGPGAADGAKKGGERAAGGGHGVGILRNGKDTAKLEAITLMDWQMELGATQGASGLLMGDPGMAYDLASDLFVANSLDPTVTTSLNPTSNATRGRGRRGGKSAASGATSDAAGASLAEALAAAAGGGGGVGLGVEVFEAEGCDFDLEAEQQLLAMDQAEEMFDMPPDMDLFGADLQEMLAPTPEEDFMAGDAPNGAEAPPPAGAPSDPSRSQSTAAEDAQVQHGPEDAADAAEGGAGSDAPKKVAVSRRRGVKRRANAPLVDAPNDMQISNSTYREWVKDASHITAARPKRGSASGDDSGGEGSPNAKNNAAGCSDTWAGLMPASAFAGGLLGMGAGGSIAWGEATLAAFRLCAAGLGGGNGGAGDGYDGPAGAQFEEVLLFRGDGEGGAAGARGRRGARGEGAAGEGREGAARAAKRARFGELPLEEGYYDMEEAPMDHMMEGEHDDVLGDLAFGGDIETERLRAAPTPGASGEAAGGVLRAHTPGSSLGGATAAKGARGKQSGSETGSLLAPESMLRSDLRGRRRATGGLEGLLAEEGESPLARMGGRRSGSAAVGSLKDLLPDVEEAPMEEDEGEQGERGSERPPTGTLPSSQWQLLVESGTQHPTQLTRPEDSMTPATHTAIRVFRSRLLEASRKGAPAISFLAISNRLSRGEAAKAFYQVCVTNATGHIKASQPQPYGDISIAAGPQL